MKVVTLCYLRKGDEVFLAEKKKGFGIGYLNGYGGRKEESDGSIEAAAVRELREESGAIAEMKSLQKVAIIDFLEEEVHLFECHVFFCDDWSGELIETDEMAEPNAYPIHHLPLDRMWDGDRIWLPLIFSGQKIRAKSFYNKGMTRQEKFEYESLEEYV